MKQKTWGKVCCHGRWCYCAHLLAPAKVVVSPSKEAKKFLRSFIWAAPFYKPGAWAAFAAAWFTRCLLLTLPSNLCLIVEVQNIPWEITDLNPHYICSMNISQSSSLKWLCTNPRLARRFKSKSHCILSPFVVGRIDPSSVHTWSWGPKSILTHLLTMHQHFFNCLGYKNSSRVNANYNGLGHVAFSRGILGNDKLQFFAQDT